MKQLGVDTLIGNRGLMMQALLFCLSQSVTNAAGGLNKNYAVGDIVVLNDVSLVRLLAVEDLTPVAHQPRRFSGNPSVTWAKCSYLWRAFSGLV